MKLKVKNLRPGARFELVRNGCRYEYVRRDINTPYGIRHVVRRDGASNESSLHHSCLVRVMG